MSTTIVWFRRDLRLADNPALDAALRSGMPIVALYVHAQDEEGEWRPGAASNWWLHRSLQALDAQLRLRGGRLVVRRGSSLEAIQSLIVETGAIAVHWNRLYEPVIVQRDQAIKAALKRDGLIVESHNANLFVEPWEVQTQGGQPYKVFTPFWRNIATRVDDVLPMPAPKSIMFVQPLPETLPIDELGLQPTIPWDAGLASTWTPGEQGARTHLDDFIEQTTDYARERDRPDLPGTSMLSPHLHFGEISPRQILAALRRHGAERRSWMDRVDAYVRELGWREFAHHLLFHFPHTTNANLNVQFNGFDWAEPDAELLAAWQRGRTGIPMIDAGMRELWTTGWMHNRVRMVVASFLCKNLRAHWLHGARWFWDTLVDADLAANTLGWQWTAGTGADAAPYFRVFNPVLQGERFDPDGHYVRRHIPELAKVPTALIHRPWAAKPAERSAFGIDGVYAQPLVDLAATRDGALAAYQQMRSGPR